MENSKQPVLQLRKLKKHFKIKKNVYLKAVEDVSFTIYEGEKFGVVGESGCGKSTLGRVILQLYPQTSGSAVYYGRSLEDLYPKYILKDINKLMTYQKTAIDLYQKSLLVDKKIEVLEEHRQQLDSEGNPKDAKMADTINRKIAKLELESKELRKDASRNLREGSRTCGALILEKDLPAIVEIFKQAHESNGRVHRAIESFKKADSKFHNLQHKLEEGKIKPEKIAKVQEELEALKEAMAKYQEEMEINREEAKRLRKLALSYEGKNVLQITERCSDPKYQLQLHNNYENGLNLSKLTNKEMRPIRKEMQMIFQDPAASLDPRQTIGDAIAEVYAINTDYSREVRRAKVEDLLEKVGLLREFYDSYPHQLSGGQKQRVGIARAIALNTNFVVLDEAVSALDVSVQAQILQLLNDLSEEYKLTYFFITHDLGVVKHFCDRILVMYLGNACELAPSKELFAKPLHPYTVSLLNSVPRPNVDAAPKDDILQGEVPSAMNPPKGCPFHTRCPKCMDICKKVKPNYTEVEKDHFIACHLYSEEVK